MILNEKKGSTDCTMKLWSFDSKKCQETYPFFHHYASCFSSTESNMVICGLSEGSIVKFDVISFKIKQKLKLNKYLQFHLNSVKKHFHSN